MIVVRTITAIQDQIDAIRRGKKTIGLVPTMGALHDGHLSLIRACKVENDVTVVSIFVNPTQFNDPEDFKRYPRDLEKDIAILRDQACDLVFAPSNEEMYPEPDKRVFGFGALERVMEGKHRPGHFNGVAQVVSKMFEITRPDKAYFGQKDFQQLVIIRELVKRLNLGIGIVSCPIVRESDGLAMSSRNQLLTDKQRIAAAGISQALEKAVSLSGTMDIESLKELITKEIDSDPLLETEYFEIVDEQTLDPVTDWSEETGKIGCVAVRIGSVRLIDNMKIS